MKNDNRKLNEEKINTTKTDQHADNEREEKDSHKKETLAERARREHWTDVAESHLGIDE